MSRASLRRYLFAISTVFALGLAGATPALAQIVRAFTPRVSANQAGDIVLIGNTLMSCTGNGQCPNGRNGTGGKAEGRCRRQARGGARSETGGWRCHARSAQDSG